MVKNKKDENENWETGLSKVRACVPYSTFVSYIVYVKNPGDINEISEALANRDPSNWESDPCFYEILGDSWKHMVNKIIKEDIEILEG